MMFAALGSAQIPTCGGKMVTRESLCFPSSLPNVCRHDDIVPFLPYCRVSRRRDYFFGRFKGSISIIRHLLQNGKVTDSEMKREKRADMRADYSGIWDIHSSELAHHFDAKTG